MLHTEPSFCIYSNEDDTENEDLIIKQSGEKLDKSAEIGEKSMETQFSFPRNSMRMIKEDESQDEEDDREANRFTDLKNEMQSGDDVDTYYNKMVNEYPHDPLVLRNYAQFLESKNDFSGAEEYYNRAILVHPEDGITLSRLAKLVWDQHRDKAKASTYFERSTRAAPKDSDVLAAYASFLWETHDHDDDDDEGGQELEENLPKPLINDFEKERRPKSLPLHLAMGLGIGPTGLGPFNEAVEHTSVDSICDEEYHKKMVEENPLNPLYLKNYARFLHQSKRDAHGAEEYYARAILIDPGDGETLAQYADIVWHLHRDKDRALIYFQQAMQASPQDNNLLAAYAKFLWETDEV